MITNLEKYKKDLEKLILEGEQLKNAMGYTFDSEKFTISMQKELRDVEKAKEFFKSLPSFIDSYQFWYSEALTLLKQLLPDRVQDFINLYAKPKRKEITYENYVIEDALQGLGVMRGLNKVVGADAAIPRFKQQLEIVKSIKKRFESSLFDIKLLVQADLFDSELETAKELNKKGFTRGAGAVAGVILEKHLLQVCDNHTVKISKKNPSIGDYNDNLKDKNIFETPTWRKIQHLADLRNLCDHKKKKEPTKEDVEELIEGVEKIIKTIF